MTLIVNTNLFAIQEKYGLERLYSSLALNKKSVVLGRYISATLNYLFGYFVVIIVGVIISFIQGHANFYNGIIEGFCISLLTFTLVSAIQLPIYFVVGYTKGRIISMIPFLIIAGLVILQALNERLERVIRSVLDYGNSIYAICLISSIVIMVVSYYISVSCYKKRQ